MENQSPDKAQLVQIAVQQHKAFLDIKRRYVLQDFWEFNKEVMGWKDLYPPLHETLCKFIQDNRHRKRLILLPRGHLKSTIATVSYCLWRIAQNPNIRILIVNGTYDLAVTFLTQIKDHLKKNDKFIELFGDLSEGTEKWSENQITVKRDSGWEAKEPTITAFGIGGNLVSQHYDVIILDDVVNRDNIHTADRIADVHQFYKDVVDLFDNPVTSELMVIGTRWHEGDLYGTLLNPENPDHHEFAIHQRDAVEGEYQIVRDKETTRMRIEGGEILFPVKFSRDGLEKLLNEKGPSDFASQYLNDPVPSSEATFKYPWKYYEIEDIRNQEFNTFMTVDPAFYDPTSKSSDLDYTVFLVLQVNKENDWFIRDIVRQRMQPKEIVDMMFEMDNKWKPKTIGLETTAYQKILGYAARDMMRTRDQFLPITELRHSGSTARSKGERIQGLEPRYAVGSIYHNKAVRHIDTLEMELRRFPRAKTDDCADALASMLEIAYSPAKKEQRSEGRKQFMRTYTA